MNLICPRCGEAYDFDSVADADTGRSRKDNFRAFTRKGCEAINESHTWYDDLQRHEEGLPRADTAAMVYELMGDDIDGAASEFDDLGW